MEQSSSKDEQTVRHQFDWFCKLVLHGEKVNYEREMEYRSYHEISISYLTDKELNYFSAIDEYTVESEIFHVLNYDIEIKNELLSEALKYLSEKKRTIVLLSFFMGMSDTDIAKYMKLARSTIHHHRTNSIRILKKFMEEIGNDRK
jgi:hypothetical protein